MSIRFTALSTALNRSKLQVAKSTEPVSNYYGSHVFGDAVMKKDLTPEAYTAIKNATLKGEKIDEQLADQVASAMKAWASARGVTHYTHWFQPLTGGTAEKHDAFFEPDHQGGSIEKFEGSLLIQQEPDASSFPNGGIRQTFEARGYTAWDPSSPAFIIGTTLCIPTIFVSYTGEALDNKTPLLRALQVIDEAAVSVCQYFDESVTKVNASLGWEQEYFLVDSALYNSRPDLVLTGRTLIGHAPAKGQQLDDHYFGSIPERVLNFMQELEYECHLLGIPVKTRHNEVAPGQYELAPIYEEANTSVDHNSLLMDVMDKVAIRHDFRVLLHEKPFAQVNGSGKHNNWSLGTNTGKNLLSPGKTPESNLQFLTFFINTIKAIDTYGDLIRASIASAGNDHRLGANEAPPAIVSTFIGSQLSAVLNQLENTDFMTSLKEKEERDDQKLNVVNKIPEIKLDNTDRNRTSPFAFTGNKFELRAVGSAANCAEPMTVLNTIMAQQLKDFREAVDLSIEFGVNKEDAIFSVLKEYIKSSKNVRFEGDGYSDDWVKLAEDRGLNNVKTTPQALDFYVTETAKKLFADNNIMSRVELEARHEIQLEKYFMRIQIESRVLGDLAVNHIVPAGIRYQQQLSESLNSLKAALSTEAFEKTTGKQVEMLGEVAGHINSVISLAEDMLNARKKANKIEDARDKAIAYCEEVKPYFDKIRKHVDKLEQMVDDELWPLPKYRELLFVK